MRKNKIISIILLIALVIVTVFFIVNRRNGSLVSPKLVQPSSTPAASLYNPPQEIRYDSSTDLEKELGSINPELLDSDFE